MRPSGAVEERTGWLERDGGPRLHFRAWVPAEARATLLVVHGLGEHSGRYARLGDELARLGIAVYAPDLRGHGLSPGSRGHVGRFRQLVDDLEALRVEVQERAAPGAPTFLLGHSLGGLVVARHLQLHAAAPLRGAVLSAPVLRILIQPPAWKLAIVGFCSRYLPSLPLSNEIDPAWLTQDLEAIRSLELDPLAHVKITPRMYTEMLAAMEDAVRERERLRVSSLLLLLPGRDRVVDAEATRRWVRGVPERVEVEVREYPDSFHEVLNELERDEVVRYLAAWIEARSG